MIGLKTSHLISFVPNYTDSTFVEGFKTIDWDVFMSNTITEKLIGKLTTSLN